MDVQRFRRSFYVPPDVSANPSVLRRSGARDPQGRNLTVTLWEAAAENVTATGRAPIEGGDTAESDDFTDLSAATWTLTFTAAAPVKSCNGTRAGTKEIFLRAGCFGAVCKYPQQRKRSGAAFFPSCHKRRTYILGAFL